MKTYIFTDTKTGETFTVTCEPYQIHYIERINEDFDNWANGRIIIRSEQTNEKFLILNQ